VLATPTPTRSGQRFAHLRALDGLRGMAVVLVVLSHFASGLAPGGFLGVDLFFVLSGFLITSLLVSEWEATDHISLPNFWLRRARRLYPALVVMVAVVLLHTWLTSSRFETRNVAIDGLSALFYVANWRFIASGQSYILQFIQRAPSPLRHTWSLAIEEQFYLVWPLVAVGVSRLVGGRRVRATDDGSARPSRMRPAMATVSVVGAIASLGWMILLEHRGASLDRLYYGTDTRVFMILAGAALGSVTAGRPFLVGRLERLRPAVSVAGFVALVALILACLRFTTSSLWLFRGGYGLVAVGMVVLLLAAAQPGPNLLARLFETRPLVGLGLISYGIYLWHWPISLWVTESSTHLHGVTLFVVQCAFTLGVSLISYYVVEQPIRRGWLPNVDGRGRKLVAPLVVIMLVLGLAVPAVAFPAVKTAPTTPLAAGTADTVTTGYAGAPRCDDPGSAKPITTKSHVIVQLEGNSLADEVEPCLGQILHDRGATLNQTLVGGFLICRDTPKIEQEARQEHPVAAILFLFVAYNFNCGKPWHGPIDRLVAFYKSQGIHVFLAPSVPVVEGGRDDLAPGPPLEYAYYRQLAAADPANITFVDAGRFVRDDHGTYLWRMPCLDRGEPGCAPDDTVGVRFVDGVHFCTDPNFAAHGCVGAEHQAGERRVSASIAEGVLPELTKLLASRRN
jgi:peptidoglycan/LPS O-acetylase OafA/YrhL